jgi:hypothetical protein
VFAVIQTRPSARRVPEAPAITSINNEGNRRHSHASSFFDAKSPIDDWDNNEDLEMGQREGGQIQRGIGSKRELLVGVGKTRDVGRSKSGAGAGKKKAIPRVDVQLTTTVDHDNSNKSNSNNPYLGHYKLNRPRPTTEIAAHKLDLSTRLELDIGKSTLSLPTLEYSPRRG